MHHINAITRKTYVIDKPGIKCIRWGTDTGETHKQKEGKGCELEGRGGGADDKYTGRHGEGEDGEGVQTTSTLADTAKEKKDTDDKYINQGRSVTHLEVVQAHS